ncbi:MAG: formate/nitrite transporter family protein [Akkermansia sp.]|nr:formate/nitrite transporter family protein [Akkermansia sp.]
MNAGVVATWRSAFMAGVCVGIAGFGYLATRDMVGSVLFAFALLAVVHYKLKLYTGTAGFIRKDEVGYMLQVLAGNILGCLAVALLTRVSAMDLQGAAQAVLEGRLGIGPFRGGILSVGCGFIMTTAVTFARKGSYLPLLFGVPLFIVCGFPHCVADAFYYLAAPLDFWVANFVDILIFYFAIVLGNFVGCNFYRWIIGSNPE